MFAFFGWLILTFFLILVILVGTPYLLYKYSDTPLVQKVLKNYIAPVLQTLVNKLK